MSDPTTIEEVLRQYLTGIDYPFSPAGTTKNLEEALTTIEQLVIEKVIGKSPENPYSVRDAFMHHWGRQASEYDKHIRAMQRQALTQLLRGKE